MKRILAIFLAALMMLTFVACNGDEGENASSTNTSEIKVASGNGFNGGGTTDTDTSNADGTSDDDGEIVPGNNITCTYEDEKCKTTVIFIFEDGEVIESNYNVTYYTEEDAKDNYNFMMSSEDVYYDVELNDLNLTYCDNSLVGSSMDEIIEMCEALGEWTRD